MNRLTVNPRAHLAVEPTPAGVVDVAYLLRAVTRSAPLVVLLTAAGVGAGLWLALQMQPSYSANAKVLIEPRTWQIGTIDLAEGAYRYNENLIRSRIEVMQSAAVLSDVVDGLSLQDEPSFTDEKVEIAPGIEEPQKRIALRSLYEALSITQSGLSDVIDIEATAESPQLAAGIANAVARSYVENEAASRTAQLEETAVWLSRRLTELAANVSRSASQLEAFRAQNSGIDEVRVTDLTKEISRLRDTAAGLSSQARATVLSRIASIEAELAQMGEGRVRLSELERQATSDRQLYEQQLERAKVLQEAQDLRLSDARIIDTALPPLEKSGPKRKLYAAGGGLLGLLMGILAALAHGAYGRRVQTPADVRADLGQQVAAVVPLGRRIYDSVMGPALSAALRPVELAASAAGTQRGLVLVAGVGRHRGAAAVAAGLARAAVAAGRGAIVIDYSTDGNFLKDLGVSRNAGVPVELGTRTTLLPLGFDLAVGQGLSREGWPSDAVDRLMQDYGLVVLYVPQADSPLARAVVGAFDATLVPVIAAGWVKVRHARRIMTALQALSPRQPVVVLAT